MGPSTHHLEVHVTRTLTRALGGLLRLDEHDPGLLLPVLVRYSPADPYAVRLVLLLDADSSVEWLLDRDALADAVRSSDPVGLGDVRLWSDGDAVVAELGDERPARLHLPLRDVVEALVASYALVPTGAEQVDLSGVEALLADGG